MRILTWNVNGIRSLATNKLPLKKLFEELDCDIVCLQETKLTKEFLDEKVAIVDGYSSYFSHSKVKSGYSGVAIFVRDNFTPVAAEEGLSGKINQNQRQYTTINGIDNNYGMDTSLFSDDELLALDGEGRCIMTEHLFLDTIENNISETTRSLVIINIYCPRADPERPERLSFKLRFYELLRIRAEALLRSGRHVIIVGDINTCHRPIDHCDPVNDEDFVQDPGRQWMDGFITKIPSHISKQTSTSLENDGAKFVDLLRLFEPTTPNLFTNWCSSTGARATNYGCRIDYIFADIAFASRYGSRCFIRPEVMGSDHCPVVAHFNCRVIQARKCPPLCSKYLAQFSGKQTKLRNYFFNSGDSCTISSQGSSSSNSNRSSSSSSSGGGSSCSGVGNSSSSISSNNSSSSTTSNGYLAYSNSNNIDVNCSNNSEKDICTRSSINSNFSRKRTTNIKSKTKLKTNCGSMDRYLKLKYRPTDTIREMHSQYTIDERISDIVDTNSINQFPLLTNNSPLCDLKENNLNELTYSPRSQPIPDHHDNHDTHPIPGTDPSLRSLPQVITIQSDPTGLKRGWGSLLKGPPKPPLCRGHNEPCVLRTVKKEGPNRGRQFWVCNRPEGHKLNPLARCDFFVWVREK